MVLAFLRYMPFEHVLLVFSLNKPYETCHWAFESFTLYVCVGEQGKYWNTITAKHKRSFPIEMGKTNSHVLLLADDISSRNVVSTVLRQTCWEVST